MCVDHLCVTTPYCYHRRRRHHHRHHIILLYKKEIGDERKAEKMNFSVRGCFVWCGEKGNCAFMKTSRNRNGDDELIVRVT